MDWNKIDRINEHIIHNMCFVFSYLSDMKNEMNIIQTTAKVKEPHVIKMKRSYEQFLFYYNGVREMFDKYGKLWSPMYLSEYERAQKEKTTIDNFIMECQ